jgi:hypothetical protein
MTLALPDTNHRLRCGRCGNLTRFDVVRSSTVKEFWHFDMAGNHEVESSEVSRSEVSSIVCRWCGATDEVEHVLRPDAGGPSAEPESAH